MERELRPKWKTQELFLEEVAFSQVLKDGEGRTLWGRTSMAWRLGDEWGRKEGQEWKMGP